MEMNALLRQICRHVSSFVHLVLILLLSISKQELVIIMKIHRFLFALNVAVSSYQFLEYLSYYYVIDFFFCKKEYQ